MDFTNLIETQKHGNGARKLFINFREEKGRIDRDFLGF